MAYLVLFGSCFLSATILPFYSEAVLVYLLREGHPAWALLIVATIGNTLGSVVNWGLGRYALRYRDRRWFPAGPERLERSQRWFTRYGKWSLLLAWLPVGGDALTVVAGILRVPLATFVALVGLGKGLRYLAVYAAASALLL